MVCYLPALNFFNAAIQQRWMNYLAVLWHYLSLLSSVGLSISRSIPVVIAALQLLSTGMLQYRSAGIAMFKPPVSPRRTGVPSRLSFSNDSVPSCSSFSSDSIPSHSSFPNDSASSQLPFLDGTDDSVPSRLPPSSVSATSRLPLSSDSVPSHSLFSNDSVSTLPNQLPFLNGTASRHLSSHDSKKPNQRTRFAKKHAIRTVTKTLSSLKHVPREQPRSTISFTIHFCLSSHVVKIFSCLQSVNEYARIIDCLTISNSIEFQKFTAPFDGKILSYPPSTLPFLSKHLSLLHLSIYDTNCFYLRSFYLFIRCIRYDTYKLQYEGKQLTCMKTGKIMKVLLTKIVIITTTLISKIYLAHVCLCISNCLSTFYLLTRCNRDFLLYGRQRTTLTTSADYNRNGTLIDLIALVAFQSTTATIINKYRYHKCVPKYVHMLHFSRQTELAPIGRYLQHATMFKKSTKNSNSTANQNHRKSIGRYQEMRARTIKNVTRDCHNEQDAVTEEI